MRVTLVISFLALAVGPIAWPEPIVQNQPLVMKIE